MTILNYLNLVAAMNASGIIPNPVGFISKLISQDEPMEMGSDLSHKSGIINALESEVLSLATMLFQEESVISHIINSLSEDEHFENHIKKDKVDLNDLILITDLYEKKPHSQEADTNSWGTQQEVGYDGNQEVPSGIIINNGNQGLENNGNQHGGVQQVNRIEAGDRIQEVPNGIAPTYQENGGSPQDNGTVWQNMTQQEPWVSPNVGPMYMAKGTSFAAATAKMARLAPLESMFNKWGYEMLIKSDLPFDEDNQHWLTYFSTPKMMKDHVMMLTSDLFIMVGGKATPYLHKGTPVLHVMNLLKNEKGEALDHVYDIQGRIVIAKGTNLMNKYMTLMSQKSSIMMAKDNQVRGMLPEITSSLTNLINLLKFYKVTTTSSTSSAP